MESQTEISEFKLTKKKLTMFKRKLTLLFIFDALNVVAIFPQYQNVIEYLFHGMKSRLEIPVL